MKPASLAPFLLLVALLLVALAEKMEAAGGWAWLKAGTEAVATC